MRRGPRRDVLDGRIGDAGVSRWPTWEMRTALEGGRSAPPTRIRVLSSTKALSTRRSAHVHLAAGDASAAWEAYEAARERTAMDPQTASIYNWAALAPLACGDLAAARRWADDVVSATKGWSLAAALTSRARVEIAQGELDAAERDAYDALDLAAAPRR